ncbi:MAG: RdgB/HAM1 family non-canonical purine NTP pyrophosphatase [Clostridia bacterium]|nr:RdgB/HAM1 family non-canonical purine NTP pyrophosphatase [Clostridia bacterium]
MKPLKLVLASRNQHKVREINAMISDYLPNVTVLSLDDVGLYDDVEETGATFEENARLKARYAAKSGYIAFADDSGLVVPALGGAPGVYSARYAGDHGDDAANRKKLLEELGKSPDRAAAFVCCIACTLPDGRSFAVHGFVEGEILCFERGEGGFGYDNLFWYDPTAQSFAEMTPEEKNAVSHRRRAIAAFAAQLAPILSEMNNET